MTAHSPPKRIAAIALLFSLLSLGAFSLAQQPQPADNVEDHAALAQSYRSQAADLRAQSARHKKSAQLHRRIMSAKSESAHRSMARHCDKLAAQLANAAAEADSLAKLHEDQLHGN